MERRECDIVAALLGAPNTGKTSLFNTLTGKAEKVANWPGVTVEVKTAVLRSGRRRVCIVDLPGTYSLSGTGPEERLARDFIVNEKPDVVVVLVDSTSPERGLHLALEAREAGLPTIIALTKIDAARSKGVEVDIEGLERDLGAPVVATSAFTGEGIEELRRLLASPERLSRTPLQIVYGGELEEAISKLEATIASRCRDLPLPARWLAVRLLEGLDWVKEMVAQCDGGSEIVAEAERLAERLNAAQRILSRRYELVEEIAARRFRAVRAAAPGRLDLLLMRPSTGIPLSLAILASIFLIVFTVSTGFPFNIILEAVGAENAAAALEEYSLSGLLGALFDKLAELVESSVGGWLGELLGQGVVAGVGLVLSFLPLIMLVYAVFAALEDSGLAARMAVAYEPLMRRLGVSGKAIFPAIMGLGCNVPAVISTRILESRSEKLAVAVAVPFIPCQARLVILLAFIAAFYRDPAVATLAALGVYGTAFAVYLITLKIVTSVVGRGEEEYVLEIPPLKKPSLKVVWWQVRDAAEHFLIRAGTVILALSVLTWLATSYTPWLAPAEHPDESIAAYMGRLLAPLAEVVFDVDWSTAWRLSFGFIQGLVAKEVFLDALAMVAPPGVEVETPADAVAYLHLTPVQAFAVLLALTLYMPCIATLATIFSELKSWKATLAALAYSLLVATLVAWLARILLAPFA